MRQIGLVEFFCHCYTNPIGTFKYGSNYFVSSPVRNLHNNPAYSVSSSDLSPKFPLRCTAWQIYLNVESISKYEICGKLFCIDVNLKT